jgi:protein dithiol oxidoreductase (disulfide-forming)
MRRVVTILFRTLGLWWVSSGLAASVWTEGKDYDVLESPQRTNVAPGKIEVMEVFSYACVFCNKFQPTVENLERHLPLNAQMVFLPAAFNPAEDWPMFQRAYFTAQQMGIAERTHQAMFDAVWKTHELGIDKYPLPSLEDAARCYARISGVKVAEFLAAAKSFGVDNKIRAADDAIVAMRIPGTPCIVVNGKYRVNSDAMSDDKLIGLVTYLVNKETPVKAPKEASRTKT